MSKVYFTYNKNYINLNENYLSKLDESKQNRIYSEKFTKELLKNRTVIQKMKSNKENFYIIEKKEFKIFGPINESEFKKLKQKLKINLNFG